jgi:hypothetical protein
VPKNHGEGGDPRAFNSAPAWWFAGGLVLALVIIFAGLRLTESFLSGGKEVAPVVVPPVVGAAPHLQIDPHADLVRFRADEEARLHSYGWVDRKAGVIHIPIERAMELTAQRGLPARAPAQGEAP